MEPLVARLTPGGPFVVQWDQETRAARPMTVPAAEAAAMKTYHR
jgi:hypothetical protein